MPSLTWATGMVTSPLGAAAVAVAASPPPRFIMTTAATAITATSAMPASARCSPVRLFGCSNWARFSWRAVAWELCVPPVRFFLFCFPDKAFLPCVAGIPTGRLS